MFKLSYYFSVTSLIVFVIVAILFLVFFQQVVGRGDIEIVGSQDFLLGQPFVVGLGVLIALVGLYLVLFFIIRQVDKIVQRQYVELAQNKLALQESVDQFRQVIASLSDHVYIAKFNQVDGLVYQYISPNVEALTGYSAEKVMADPGFWANTLVYPEDRRVTAEQFKRLAAGKDSEMEYRLIHADGTLIWVRDLRSVVKNASEADLLVYGAVSDITQRKETEEIVWENARRFRSLIQNASEVIAILDTDGIFRYSSPSALRILGYESADIVGQPIFDMVHPDDAPLLAEAIERAMQQPNLGIPIAECRIRHSNESWRIFATTLTNLFETPTVNGFLLNCLDITERKRAEEVVHKQEEQLRQAQKMEAVGRLAGGIAHDFNNILTAIVGYTELVLNDTASNDLRHADLLKVRQNADRATALTRQLLAFGRKQMLQPKILDLNLVVTDISKMLQRLIGEDVELILRLKLTKGRVNVDISQLEQVVMNLCLNARDAMPQGGKLTIETGNVYLDEEYINAQIEIDPGPYALLVVSDTGIGMDAETQAHIFEPFFTTKGPGIGTGLGLATVFGIVKQSGGHIHVYSEVGQGTTIKIYLPQIEGPVETTAPEKIQAKIGGSETILVVEDQEAIRDLVQRSLSSYGYQVLTARDGLDALSLCQNYPSAIQLVLTDVVMPNMSGKTLVENLVPLRPGLKVLFMSGYTDQAIVHHGVVDPNIPFIHKPFSSAALADKVRQVLDGRAE